MKNKLNRLSKQAIQCLFIAVFLMLQNCKSKPTSEEIPAKEGQQTDIENKEMKEVTKEMKEVMEKMKEVMEKMEVPAPPTEEQKKTVITQTQLEINSQISPERQQDIQNNFKLAGSSIEELTELMASRGFAQDAILDTILSLGSSNPKAPSTITVPFLKTLMKEIAAKQAKNSPNNSQ